MPTSSLEISNFLVFNNDNRENKDSFKINFCDGINVLIGENGVGKTTILKAIYHANKYEFTKVAGLDNLKNLTVTFHKDNTIDQKYISKNSYNEISEKDKNKTFYTINGTIKSNQAVFIPTTEMLSHSKGLLALNQKYKMPFDETEIDIIVNASLPEIIETPTVMQGILEKISNVIDGTVVMEDDVFYVVKNNGAKIEFSLESEGLRKFGLLWKLIRNGLFEKNNILLWDEPEANLNPELYPLVVEILLELQKNDIQIFIATHSYNFAKYLEIFRKNKEQVLYHNIYKKDNGIYSQSAYKMDELTPNHIIDADIKLLNEVYNQ